MQIVWFKRDLRIEDNAPLAAAAVAGPVIPLYILEPELWQQPDMSGRHYDFLGECLAGLDRDLTAVGRPLVLRVGDAVDGIMEVLDVCAADAIEGSDLPRSEALCDRVCDGEGRRDVSDGAEVCCGGHALAPQRITAAPA